MKKIVLIYILNVLLISILILNYLIKAFRGNPYIIYKLVFAMSIICVLIIIIFIIFIRSK